MAYASIATTLADLHTRTSALQRLIIATENEPALLAQRLAATDAAIDTRLSQARQVVAAHDDVALDATLNAWIPERQRSTFLLEIDPRRRPEHRQHRERRPLRDRQPQRPILRPHPGTHKPPRPNGALAMSRRNKLLLVALLALGSALTVFETRLISAQRTEQPALSARLDEAQRTLTRAQHHRDGVARDLALAEQQLARASTLTVPSPSPAADQTVAAWHSRAKQLHALAAAQPAGVIPEMKMLTEEDWLRVAQTAAFATDEQRRQALAALRTTAKQRFTALLSAVLSQFKSTHAQSLPTAPLDLAPFLAAPADAAMLARYSVFRDGPTATTRDAWIIRETAAIDPDYDSRHNVNASGGFGSSSGFSAWQADLAARVQRAYQAYTTAHPGQHPASIAHVVPFIDPPLPPATLDKLLQAELNHAR